MAASLFPILLSFEVLARRPFEGPLPLQLRLPVYSGIQLLVTGYWLLVTGYWLLTTSVTLQHPRPCCGRCPSPFSWPALYPWC
ncbi:MAG TPA: hypothetical protein DER10_09100 [Elusimicrobia bacterium]|nr:hypothetical protein [Elusimicrobiota bacterium]HCE98637.1 hypothetical protein [Elusimicrobiota bacterium]